MPRGFENHAMHLFKHFYAFYTMHPFYSYNVVTTTKARDYLPSPRTVTAHVPQMLRSLCSCHKHNHEYNLTNPNYQHYS